MSEVSLMLIAIGLTIIKEDLMRLWAQIIRSSSQDLGWFTSTLERKWFKTQLNIFLLNLSFKDSRTTFLRKRSTQFTLACITVSCKASMLLTMELVNILTISSLCITWIEQTCIQGSQDSIHNGGKKLAHMNLWSNSTKPWTFVRKSSFTNWKINLQIFLLAKRLFKELLTIGLILTHQVRSLFWISLPNSKNRSRKLKKRAI